MTEKEAPAFIQCGRRVSAEEIEQIKETVELFPRLSLKELVATICEHLGWHTAANNLKIDACRKLLMKLEATGIVKLPEKRKEGGVHGYSPEMVVSSRTDSWVEITGTVKELRRVSLEAVKEKQEKELWNEYVFRYHGLGYKRPFGYWMRYFISCEQGKLGCVLFSGAAKALRMRDQWIGWSAEQRLKNLAWVCYVARPESA